jgi:mannose-1-phosphate guanylyltransferase
MVWENTLIKFRFSIIMDIPSISIDYAVMEHSKKIKVVSSHLIGVSLGSCESVYDYLFRLVTSE